MGICFSKPTNTPSPTSGSTLTTSLLGGNTPDMIPEQQVSTSKQRDPEKQAVLDRNKFERDAKQAAANEKRTADQFARKESRECQKAILSQKAKASAATVQDVMTAISDNSAIRREENAQTLAEVLEENAQKAVIRREVYAQNSADVSKAISENAAERRKAVEHRNAERNL